MKRSGWGSSCAIIALLVAAQVAVVLFSPAGHALASENIIRAEGVYMLQEYPEDVFFQQLTRSDEHCLVCETLLEVTLVELPSAFSYMQLFETMATACLSPQLFNFTHRYVKYQRYRYSWKELSRHNRIKNYTALCLQTVDIAGDLMADLVWEHWGDWYFHGLLPRRVCGLTGGCNVTDPRLLQLRRL